MSTSLPISTFFIAIRCTLSAVWYTDVHDSDELSDDELVKQLAFIDDRDLQKHGLKLSYTTSKGRKLQGSAALDEMQREAERAKKAQEQDEQEVVEMVRIYSVSVMLACLYSCIVLTVMAMKPLFV